MPADSIFIPNSALPVASALFPPVLTPAQLAMLVDRTTGAIYHWPAAQKLHGIARKRGKHWLIWRDRAIASQSGTTFRVNAHGGIGLTPEEVVAAFELPQLIKLFPPFLSPDSLADLLHVGRSTIYRWIAHDYLDGTFTKRTDGLRFNRNNVLLNLFNNGDWN